MIDLRKYNDYEVQLNDVQTIKDFVQCITANCNSDVLLYKGRYSIDAKSLMGVLSLDLSKNVNVRFVDKTDFEKVNSLMPHVFV